MQVSICTISFRHHMLSLAELALWAQSHQFQGIELWGVHARNMVYQPHFDADWLAAFGLTVPMVSDYLPTTGDDQIMLDKTQALCHLASHWGAAKIRTFAGNKGSGEISNEERNDIVRRLRLMTSVAMAHGKELLVETHPGTLTDCGTSTLRLLEEVNLPGFKLNFDTLHVWEGGDDPVTLLKQVKAHVSHYHLKNIASREQLGVFAPANVYAAAGSREGMVPLFEGVVDYPAFLEGLVSDSSIQASLEWFGNACFDVLKKDRCLLLKLARGARYDGTRFIETYTA